MYSVVCRLIRLISLLVLVSLKFIVLQEQRKDQTPSPKIIFTGKKKCFCLKLVILTCLCVYSKP